MKFYTTLAIACIFASNIQTASAQTVLYSFEEDEEDWIATTSNEDFSDPDAILTVVEGVGNTDGDKSLQIEGRTGEYIRHAEVTFDFDRVDEMNEAIEEGWNLEFDWTIVASENPGATRFWVQFAMQHTGGWSQVDLFADESFDNGGWQEWDPNGPEVQTMTASIPLEDFGDNVEINNGYCCGTILDGFASSYQVHLAVGGSLTEEGPRTFYLDNIRLVDPDDIVSVPGDFDGDQILTADDIDILTNAVLAGRTDEQFDVDSNGQVDASDRVFWVNTLRKTYLGDSNMDGEFSSSDFVTVFSANQYEDGIPSNSTWATGDWNGDGDFDTSDFVAAFSAGGYEQGPRPAAAVPEPTVGLLMMGAIAMLSFRKRR